METVGRLVGAVAHDFANILTLIAGYSDILLNRVGEQDPLRPELDEIRKAANRGARLTAQLLGFTRGQAVQPRPLDLNAVVCDIQRMLQLIIGECVELELELCPALHKVVADPGQMEQVVMNLVLNARDAIPGGGRIRIETKETEIGAEVARQHGVEPGAFVTLSIADNGHGISADALAHIFEPFFTTKEKGKGTGLGLSTVHRIVKETGGDIWVDSAPGYGSTFTICLPFAAIEPSHAEAAAPVVAAPGSETLLVVEDEDGVRRLLTHVLHRRGYRVIEAANGEEALELFEKHAAEISLVLTDMVMPQMSGRELGSLLEQERPGVKIIYMSGYTDDVLVRTGALSPGMSFLQKPLRPEVLAAKVREALDSAETSRGATN
jgi:CheY-like chemotaxis protein